MSRLLDIEINQPMGAPIPRGRLATKLEKALTLTGHKSGSYRVSIAFIDDRQMRRLNKQYRGKDKTTDVLAFPFTVGDMPGMTDGDLGEILISHQQAKRQARTKGRRLEDEIQFLAVHAMLHLLGYDHNTTREEARMDRLAAQALGKINT